MYHADTPGEGEGDVLLEAARRGQRRAFRDLYDAHRQDVYRLACRLLGNVHEAEDVVQEVFVTLYRRLHAFENRAAFSTWLYRITVNKCYDRMRKDRRRGAYRAGSVDEDMAWHWEADGPEARPALGLMRRDVAARIDQALMQLSPGLRATLLLRDVNELSYSEIASVLSCSMGTVASRLARARRQVAAYLRQAGIDMDYLNES